MNYSKEKGLRVAILNLTGSGISGGYKIYLQNMLPLLASDSRIEAILCASPRAFGITEWVSGHRKLKFVDCAPAKFLNHRPDSNLLSALDAFSPDVIFVPVSKFLRFRDVPIVTMIQNMAPLTTWKWYGWREKVRLAAQWVQTRIAVHKSARVIAMSDFVRQFLLRSWEVAEDKVSLIYFGITPPSENTRRPSTIPPNWGGFILAAGSLEPYRGLEDVIQAAGTARLKHGRPLRVVIAGSSRRSVMSYSAGLRDKAEKLGVSEDICWAGQLSEDEMAWCYRNCSLVLMTSRVESFAVVVLEAMAYACHCIAANNPPFPEAFGNACEYYQPGDSAGLLSKIYQAESLAPAQKKQIRDTLRIRGHAFSWESTSRKTIETLAEAAARNI